MSEPVEQPAGVPYGIIDPDYARIFTMARVICWSEGYALTMHGSFTRDLDLLAVPWTESVRGEPSRLVHLLAGAANLTITGEPSKKPHGRLAWSLLLPGIPERRWVDFSVMPAIKA